MAKDLTTIALTLASIALISMLVTNADKSVTLIKGVAGAYGGLLQAATLQNGFGNSFSF